MDYLNQLISDDMGPEYVPQLPAVPSVQGNYSITEPVQEPAQAGVPSDPFADLKSLAQVPKNEEQNAVHRFEGDITRFKENKNYNIMGYNPNLKGTEVNGKWYDPNEIKYQKVQTWGDVMSNAMGQFAGLAWNSFKNSAVSDGHLLNAIFNPDSWNNGRSFTQDMMGSPDELLQQDMEQKHIMNKYAIFSSPETDNTVFNKEMVGNMVGQLGFTVGTGAYVVGSTLLLNGIASAIGNIAKGQNLARMGKLMESAGVLGKGEEVASILENYKSTQNVAKAVEDLKKLGDIAKNRETMTKFWTGLKNMVPGAEAVTDVKAARTAGATWSEAASAGLPGLIKSYTLFNAARSEASMEAAGTYGQLYMDLLDKYEKEHGVPASGADAEKIKNMAYGAATDNYIVNTGLLMAMNEMEFGNMLSKFSSSKRLYRVAAEAAEHGEGANMFKVSGTAKRDIGEGLKAGQKGTKVYERGTFGAMGKINTIRKDWGLGTALWQGVKGMQKGALKFELGEGIQEILQSTSDETFRDYYSNLYHGNKNIDGGFLSDVTSADWKKGLNTQMNIDGWKTFLMGATTGLFLSPLSASTMYLRQKGASALNQQYRDQLDAAKKMTKDNVDILNSFYSNPAKALSEHMAAWKTSTKAASNMTEALPENDKYHYYNSQDDTLAKAAAVAIKTGNIESMLSTLQSLGDGRMTDAELREALNLPDTGEDTNPRTVLQNVVGQIEQYHNNWQNLKDQYAGLILPEIYDNPADRATAIIQKKAIDDAIEVLATTSHHAAKAIERALKIKGDVAAIPGIGASSSRAFELMGSEKELANEVRRLREMASASSGLKDKEATQLANQANKQADVLEAWGTAYKEHQRMKKAGEEEYNTPGFTEVYTEMSNKLKDIFRQYIQAHNDANNGPVLVNHQHVEKAFNALGDYMALNRDSEQYIDALNVLSDPHMFRALHTKITEGMKYAKAANKVDATEEIKDRADATASGEEPSDTTADVTEEKETNTPEEKPKPTRIQLENAEEIKKDIIEVFSQPATERELTEETDEFLKGDGKRLRKELNIMIVLRHDNLEDWTDEKYNKELETKVTKWFADHVEGITTTTEEPTPEETVTEEPQPEQSTTEPKTKILRERDQVRIYPIEDRSLYNTLQVVQNENGKWDVIDTANGNKLIGTKDTQQEAKDAIRRRIGMLAQLKMDNILRSIPKEELDEYLSLHIKDNDQYIEDGDNTYPLGDNQYVTQNRSPYTLEIRFNNSTIGFITAPNLFTYTFNGQQVDTQALTVEQFKKVFEVGDRNADAVLRQWKSDHVVATALAEKIAALTDHGMTDIGGAVLQSILDISVSPGTYEYINDDKGKRPTLQQLEDAGNKVLSVETKDGSILYGNPANLPYAPNTLTAYTRAAIQLPNGTVRWVEVQAPDVAVDNTYMKGIADMLKQANDLEHDSEERNAVVEQLQKKVNLFLTTEPGTVLNRVDVKVGDFTDGVKLWLQVKPSTAVGKKVFKTNLVTKSKIDNSFLSTENPSQALIDAINELDGKVQEWAQKNSVDLQGQHLKVTGVRIDTPKQPGISDIMGMQAATSKNVVSNLSLTYSVKEGNIVAEVEPVVPEVVVEEPSIKGGTQTVQPAPAPQPSQVQTTAEATSEQHEDIAEVITDDADIHEILNLLNIEPPVQDSKIAEIEKKKREDVRPSINDVLEPSQADYEEYYIPERKYETEEDYNTAVQAWEKRQQGYDKEIKTLKSAVVARKVISSEPFTDNSVVNIDTFKQWGIANLPESIVIEDMGILTHNLGQQNITVGQFLTDLRTIQVYRNTPYKYHEAFHAIFRLLLPEDRIQQLLVDAKKASGMDSKKLDKFRQLHPAYAAMGKEQLEDLYAEEYMADMLDKFMEKKPTRVPGTIKGWFQKLTEWIKELFNKMTGRQMQSLFYEINRGKYRNAHIQDNRFSDTGLQVSQPAMKIIEIGTQNIRNSNGDIVTVPKYLPQQKGEVLASTVAALYHQMRQTESQMSKNELLDHILDMYKDMYYPVQDRYNEKQKSITNKLAKVQWISSLNDMYKVFNTPSSRQSLKEAVDSHLQLMGYKQQLEEDAYEDMENRDGVRTTADYNKEADMYGGMTSLSKLLREYVGSTTRPYTDEFGNNAFVVGVPYRNAGLPLVEAVSAAHIYNGMLKVLANSSDDNQLINRMLNYLAHGNNSETTAFIQRVMRETGFTRDEEGVWHVPNNPLLFQQVIKGFNNYDTNPIFVDMAPQGNVKVYSPNRQDSAKVQFDTWYQAFQNLFLSQYDAKKGTTGIVKEASKPFTELGNLMAVANSNRKIDDGELFDKTLEIANKIKIGTGINLHPTYLQYAVVSGKDKGARTPDQQQLYLAYEGTYAIDGDDVIGIKEALKGGDIFAKVEGDVTKGAASRLLRIAAGNAQFDETVDSMTYKGPDGETHYSSQKPNYYMVRVRQLNSPKVIDELIESPDHNNWILEDSRFLAMAEQRLLKTEMLSGLKVREVKEGEEEIQEEFTGSSLEAGKGVAYKSMGEREVQSYLLSLYGIQDNKVQTGAGTKDMFYTTPHLISVVEAKSVGWTTRMPVIKAYSTKGIPTSVVDKLYSILEQEVDRIKRVQREIADGQDNIEGYHKGDPEKNGLRGLRLYNTKLWFSKEVKEAIEQGAQNDPEYTMDSSAVKTLIKNYWEGRIQAYINYLHDQGLIGRDKNGRLVNRLLPEFFTKGFGNEDRDNKMNMRVGELEYNIAQVFMNDVLNTTALRQLLYGDEAKAFKDNIDRIKRAAGSNASGNSASFSYTAPDLGIHHPFTTFHHVTYKDPKFNKMNGEKGDKADAQMYCTEKGLRYALFGFGKLTKVQADILDKLKIGESVTEKEVLGAGGLKEHGMFNSLKVSYYDTNNVYLKCSMTPIFREETSLWNGHEWVAKPYAQEKHDLLDKLEEYEDRNSTVVYAGPETHSKGLKRNVASSAAAINDSHYEQLETQWFRLQMENPSNKTKITDPTQAKQQLLSEQLRDTPVIYMGEQTTVGHVMNQYMQDTAQRISNNYTTAANSMFSIPNGIIELDKSITAGEVTPELATFFSGMREQLEATGADQQTLAMLEVQAGQPVYDLNFPATLQKFTQLFLNHYTKVMSEKLPGVTLALVSDWGVQRIKEVLELDENGQPKRWKVVTDRQYTKDPNRYSSAKKWTDKENRLFAGLQVGDYIIDDLRHNVPEYDAQGNIIGRFTEYIRPAHWGEEMNGVVAALEKGFAVRIPSDDKHQYLAVRMVDTMPVAMGSVGVFPQELIEISGADFDIDKLFIQLQDIYHKEGRITAYSTTSDKEDAYKQYIIWQLNNNKQFRKLYKGDTIYNMDEVAAELLSSEDINIPRASAILQIMKMPHSANSYAEYVQKNGEQNVGVLNNTTLAAKITLLNNEHISGGGKDAILNQGTSTDVLKDLAGELEELGLIQPEEDTEISGLHGKGIAYINNKEGQRNIGAAINAMLAFSLTEQYGVEISPENALMYNGHTYTRFADPNTVDGKRKFAQISAIVNAMTDNAKERLAARLGLNITAVGIVATMVATGVPVKDAVLLQLQPSVREFYRRLANKNSVLQNEGDNIGVDRILQEMLSKYAQLAGEQYPSEVEGEISPALQAKMILTQDNLVDNIRDKGQDAAYQLAALQNLATVKKLADTMRTVSSVMKLNQGLDAAWEDMDRTEEQLNELHIVDGKPVESALIEPVINVAHILTEHPIFSTYIKIFTQVRELSKKVFIERTPLFQDMMAKVLNNMSVFDPEGTWTKQLKNDLISYLSIKAYIHWLKGDEEKGIPAKEGTLSTMNHALIYQVEKDKMGPEYEDIADVIKRLRDTTSNYMVNRFLNLVLHDQQGNKEKINKAEGNSWARLSENQQQRLYDSFVDLYNNEATRKDAETLFNYLLVKDGGQFRSGSFIKYIPPFAFKDLLDRTKEVTQHMATGSDDYSIFGVEGKDQLMHEFLMSYVTHISNMQQVPKVKPDIDSPITQQGTQIIMEKRNVDDPVLPAVRVNNTLYVMAMDNGQQVKYKLQPWRGSRGQWKGAGVFGDIPVPGTGKTYTKKATKQDEMDMLAAEEAMYVDNPPYSPEAPADDIQDVEQSFEEPGETRPITNNYIDELTKRFGISAITDGKRNYYINDRGMIMDQYAGMKPSELLQKLSGTTMTTAQPVVSSQTMEPQQQGIIFKEHPLSDYPSRTRENASADATIALAVDYKSAGESLTYGKVTEQGKRYIPVNLSDKEQTVSHKDAPGPMKIKANPNGLTVTPELVQEIVDSLNSTGKKEISLNIAGNGIYTMAGKYTQEQLDQFTYNLLKAVVESPALSVKVTSGRTGGQTGMDEAGAKAMAKLGIPTTILAPKGWVYRDINGKDIKDSQSSFIARFAQQEGKLSPEQWKEQLSAIYKKKGTTKNEVEWTKEALAYRNSVRSIMSDQEIINTIKECI